MRRFSCHNIGCPARAFAEQVAGLTTPRARRTGAPSSALAAIGLALAGRAGARPAAILGVVVSRDSLLRLVRALTDPPFGTRQIIAGRGRTRTRRPDRGRSSTGGSRRRSA